MKHKQAYIKLASLRLAINYVLRNRFMTKSASGAAFKPSTLDEVVAAQSGSNNIISPLVGVGIGAGLGYLLNPHKESKLWSTLGGGLLGGAAGYGLNYLSKPKTKDDYGYLRRLQDAIESNQGASIIPFAIGGEAIDLKSVADRLEKNIPFSGDPQEVRDVINDYYDLYSEFPYREQTGD